MHKAFYPIDDVDQLYVSRKERRELASIKDSVDASIQQFEDFILKKYRGRLVIAIRNKN